MMMITYMKPGWLGLMFVSFLAAFMSTIATQINWGSSYIMNDFYKRFINPNADEKHYVLLSRVFAVFIIAIALVVSSLFGTVKQAWEFLIGFTAGTGLVLILRWYWWRINAWSEISSMIASGIIFISSSTLIEKFPGIFVGEPFAWKMIITIVGSIIIWLIVTYSTKPEPQEKLISFYKKVRPGGILWEPISKLVPEIQAEKGLSLAIFDVILGVIMIYGVLFGFGKVILGYGSGWIMIAIAAIAGIALYHNISKMKN
jgi:Na+/proline symporter